MKPYFSKSWVAAVAGAATLFALIVLLAFKSVPLVPWSTTVPAPTGTKRVGSTVILLVDGKRNDPYLQDGSKRQLLVRFWYPTSAVLQCQLSEYASPKVWNHIGSITGIPLPEITTNSCLDTPVEAGLHPVVVLSHGYTGTFTDYTFIAEDLASRGYVVASVAHTYESTGVEFPDGRLMKSVVGSYLAPDTLGGDEEALTVALSTRLADLQFVAGELQKLNAVPGGMFTRKFDLKSIAVMGHSLGGVAAVLALRAEPRFKSSVILDGDAPEMAIEPTHVPVLIIAAGRERWSTYECGLWDSLRGPRVALNLAGAGHMTPTDAVWMLKNIPGLAVPAGAMGVEKTVALIRNEIAAFLDANLMGKSRDNLLVPASVTQGATVIAGEQRLCPQ